MRTMIYLLIALMMVPAIGQSRPRKNVIKIEIGEDYNHYSKSELRRRVYNLERAVYQLQEQVFHLSMNQAQRPIENPWTCMAEAFGKTFSATRGTKGSAKAEAMSQCTAKHNAMHCDVKCEQ